MWSAVELRVEAFSKGVVAPFQEKLVNKSRGVVAPFQERLVNERRLWPSAGGCLRAGMSLRQYMVVRCFLYNKILKAETTTTVVFS